MKMTLRCGLLVGLSILALTTPASATTGDGMAFGLVAIVGEPETSAIFCRWNAHEDDGCRELYLVDLAAPEKPPLHAQDCFELFDIDYESYYQGNSSEREAVCDDSEEGLRHFLASIPADRGRDLLNAPLRRVNFSDFLEYLWSRETGDELEAPPELARYEPVLRVNSRVPAMGLYNASEQADQQEGYLCRRYQGRPDGGGYEFLCPGCTETTRKIDGWVYGTTVCEQPSPECDCTGTATTFRFLIVDREEGRRHLGNRLFVQPHDLLQNFASGTEEDNHALPHLDMVWMYALVLSESILFFGMASHAYWSNDTSFRLIAVVSTLPQRDPVESESAVLDDRQSADLPAPKTFFCQMFPLATVCH